MSLVGKVIIITKRDGFKKAGRVVEETDKFIAIEFNGSGTVQAIPWNQIDHFKVEDEVDVHGRAK